MDTEHTPDEGVTPTGDSTPAADVPGEAAPTPAGDAGAPEVAASAELPATGEPSGEAIPDVASDLPVAGDPEAEALTVPAEPLDAGVVDTAGVDAPEAASAAAPAAAAAAASTGSKTLLVAGGIVVAVAAVVGGFWFVQNARGAADEALRAIPADMEFVAGLDLLAFEDTEGVDRVVAAFSDEITEGLEADEPVETLEDVIDAFEGAFAEEADIDLEEEVYPWIGRSAALGMRDLAATTDEDIPSVIAAVALRDEDGARQFIYERLPAHIEESGEETATVIPDEDGDILRIGAEEDAPYISVREGLLLLASSEALLDEATAAAAGGESISGVDQFNAATTEVVDQGLWMYFDVDAASEAVAEETEIEDVSVGGYVAAGVGMTPSGIAVDVAAQIEWTAPGADVDADFPVRLAATSSFRDGLPAGTAAYYGVPLTGDRSIGDLLREMDAEEYESRLEDLAGDPATAGLFGSLLDTLTGGIELAAMPGDPSFVIPVEAAFAVALGVVDQASGQGLVDDLAELLAGFGVGIEPGDDASLITVEGFPLGALRVTDDYIAIGTSTEAVSASDGDLLVDSELYQSLDAALPGEGLLLYIDVPALAEMLDDDSGDLDVFESVAASATQQGNRFTAHFVVNFSDQSGDAN